MAKRVPADEKPYRPVDDALVQAVLNPPRNGGGDHQESSAEPATPAPSPALDLPASPPPDPALPGDHESAAAAALKLEKLSREKRVLLSRSEERDIERLVADMAQELGTPLKLSHVLRATVLLLREAREEILTQSQRVGPLKRPHNGEAGALVAFERDLAQIIDRSLRSTSPLE
jgi:hypothetical protein